MTEREIKLEERCVTKVEATGGLALKLVILGLMGFPDRTCLLPRARIFFVEFKREGRVRIGLSKQQHRWRVALTQLGFRVYTIDSDEAFDAALKENLNG